MFIHLCENNKCKHNISDSLKFLKHGIFIFYNFFFLALTLFSFSIVHAQSAAIHSDFDKDKEELLYKKNQILFLKFKNNFQNQVRLVVRYLVLIVQKLN